VQSGVKEGPVGGSRRAFIVAMVAMVFPASVRAEEFPGLPRYAGGIGLLAADRMSG